MKILYAIAMTGMLLTSCSGNENNEAPEKEDVFAKGADISWVTEMEQKGKFETDMQIKRSRRKPCKA